MDQDSCAIFLAGVEVRQWARLTQEAGVEHVSINYRYLRERTNTERFDVAKHFPADQEIWLDPGSFSINEEKWDEEALESYLTEYVAFAEANMGALTYVTELDATALGSAWISARRIDSYGSVPIEKFVTVWHPTFGHNHLRTMVNTYPNVAVPTMDRGDAARAHGIARGANCKLMGLRMAHPFELPGGIYKAVVSASWISPAKYGEVHVWDHNRMRRYSPSQKAEARKRHANDFKAAGFDPGKIAADDKIEVPKYTIWAWQQLEASLGRSRLRRASPENTKVPTLLGEEATPEIQDFDITRVGPLLTEGAEILSSRGVNTDANLPALVEPRMIPGFGTRMVEVQVADPEDPSRTITSYEPVVTLTDVSVRQCDTCSLSGMCPCSEPGAACSLNMPVQIRTRDQLMAVLTTSLELQWKRVAFGKYAEDLEGGYPNPNLSNELDRLYKLVATFKDITDNRDTLNLQIKAGGIGGGQGLLASIFGKAATERLREVDPDAAEAVVRQAMK